MTERPPSSVRDPAPGYTPAAGAERVPAAPETALAADFERDALRWLPDVARFARALTRDAVDADDLVQETFLRAFEAWHTFRPGADARPWLFTIARRLFLRQHERDARWVPLEADAMDDPGDDALGAALLHNRARAAGLDDLFALDVGPALARALDALAEPYGAVVRLVDVEGLSYEEAAVALDVPVGTVRSRLFRARRMLQEALLVYAQDAGLARGREG